MDKFSNLKKIGIVSDAHGIRGDIYVVIFSGDVSWIAKMTEINLASSSTESVVSYKIKKIKAFKKGFIASIHEIIDRNQAEELKKQEVWIDEKLLVSNDGEQPFLNELIHFEVIDLKLGRIGKVIQFSSNGEQDLLVLDKTVNNQNIEIPFIKQFVNQVDYHAKKIMTDLPEGLIQINEKD